MVFKVVRRLSYHAYEYLRDSVLMELRRWHSSREREPTVLFLSSEREGGGRGAGGGVKGRGGGRGGGGGRG